MNEKLTDITLIVDRSGSMQSIREDAEGGINEFVRQQADEPNDARLTLVQFDNQYEFVHQGRPVKDIEPYKLVPRGMTALLDAVGRAINETGDRLSRMPEEQRPGLVIVMIVTDGMENSSREFTREQVRSMIEHQRTKYAWKFLFLAATDDAFAEAGGIGIDDGHAVRYGDGNTRATYSAMARKVSKMRAAHAAHETVASEFTAEERADIE